MKEDHKTMDKKTMTTKWDPAQRKNKKMTQWLYKQTTTEKHDNPQIWEEEPEVTNIVTSQFVYEKERGWKTENTKQGGCFLPFFIEHKAPCLGITLQQMLLSYIVRSPITKARVRSSTQYSLHDHVRRYAFSYRSYDKVSAFIAN
jgi:hypothetical protein